MSALTTRLRSVATLAGGLCAGAVAAVAGEAWMASRRRYLPSWPRLEIDGTVGSPGAPPLRLALLGDSSIAGVGADDAHDTIPHGVAAVLAERHLVHVHSLGVSGARLHDVLAEQVPKLKDLSPDVVLVGVGTNDITHATPPWRLRQDLATLAHDLPEAAPGAVLIVSGLPPCETARAFLPPLRNIVGVRARRFTRMYHRILEPAGIVVYDVAPESRDAFRRHRELFSADLFHASSAGYRYLAQLYAGAIAEAMNGPATAALAEAPL